MDSRQPVLESKSEHLRRVRKERGGLNVSGGESKLGDEREVKKTADASPRPVRRETRPAAEPSPVLVACRELTDRPIPGTQPGSGTQPKNGPGLNLEARHNPRREDAVAYQ